MKNYFNKIMSLILVAMLMVSSVPSVTVPAFAVGEETEAAVSEVTKETVKEAVAEVEETTSAEAEATEKTEVAPEAEITTTEKPEETTEAEVEKPVIYVAKIGDTEYASLADAVAAVAKNTTATPTTITLLMDQSISSLMIGHQYPQNIIVDLNGYTLSSNAIVLTAYRNGSTLTVKNGTISGNSTSGTLRATYGGKVVLGEKLTVKGAGGSATLVYADNGSVEIATADGVEFVGGKVDFKKSENVNNKISVGAAIDRTYFSTLADAFNAANDGDTITLTDDVALAAEDFGEKYDGYNTFFNVSGKTITVDFNGNTITADVSEAELDAFIIGVFCTTNGGHLTLKDSKGNGGVKGVSGTQEQAYLDASKGNTDYNYKFYSLIVNYDDNCSIVFDGGNYTLDYAGDSLIYTSSSTHYTCGDGENDGDGTHGVTVNGGNFDLGNLGGIRNGMPWVFNARGQNVRHVYVKGGSFCADIQHQYYPFEVIVPKELALKQDNGTYTVVDAVAYVTEREWSSAWYTNEIGYATLEEAIAACEGAKDKVYYNKTYTSKQERVILLTDVVLENAITVSADKSVVLDLNTHTVSHTAACTASYAMITNNGNLTIMDEIGGGKISFTDTGAGDPSFGWGSYTIYNYGTLVIDYVTVENLSEQNGTSVNHMYCAIQQNDASASTTIEGGKISTPTYRSVRVNRGSLTINGGVFEGQIWAQPSDNSVSITVNGGRFAPCGVDGSSIFIENSSKDVAFSVTGGEFSTKIGCSNAEKLAGCIKDGEFTESAKANTNSKLFA